MVVIGLLTASPAGTPQWPLQMQRALWFPPQSMLPKRASSARIWSASACIHCCGGDCHAPGCAYFPNALVQPGSDTGGRCVAQSRVHQVRRGDQGLYSRAELTESHGSKARVLRT